MGSSQGKRLIKNAFITLFNTGFLMVTSWVISIWVARQLGPANYGIFNMVLWLTGTISWAVGMGFIHAITKFIAEHAGKGDQMSLQPIVLYVLKIELVVSTVCMVLVIAFRVPIADYFFTPQESFYFFLAALGLIPGVVTAIFSATIEGVQRFEYFAWSNIIISPLSFAAKVFVLMTGKGINGLLMVMLIFSFVNALFYLFVLYRLKVFSETPGSITTVIKNRLHQYNRSVIAILVCDKIVWDKSENFFLGRFCSAAQIGYYNLGYNFVQRFMSVLPATFWRVLFPAMSTFFGTGDTSRMKRLFFIATRYLAFIAFPLGVAGTILAWDIIHFLYGNEYIGAQRTLQIFFISSIFSSLANPASAVLYGFEKQAFIYKYGAALAVFNIIINLLFIKTYGATGAAVCYGVTTLLASMGGLFYTCRSMKLRYPFGSIFKIAFSTIIMGIVMELISMRDHGLAGFIISIIAGGTVYCISAFTLGTFEEEDFALLSSAKNALPGQSKIVIDWLLFFIAQFKPMSRNGNNTDSRSN